MTCFLKNCFEEDTNDFKYNKKVECIVMCKEYVCHISRIVHRNIVGPVGTKCKLLSVEEIPFYSISVQSLIKCTPTAPIIGNCSYIMPFRSGVIIAFI